VQNIINNQVIEQENARPLSPVGNVRCNYNLDSNNRINYMDKKQILKWLEELTNKVKRYDDKTPRTGAVPPTEKEKREFAKLLPKITVVPATKLYADLTPFFCHIHKKTPLTRIRGKVRVCSKCDIK